MPWFVKPTCQISAVCPDLCGVTWGSLSIMRSVCCEACCSLQLKLKMVQQIQSDWGVAPQVNQVTQINFLKDTSP